MKLRLLIQILFLFLLILVNDGMFFGKQQLARYLSDYELELQEKIGSEPAVILIKDAAFENVLTDISNQYFVKSVKVIEHKELVEMLSEQYRLTDSEALLQDLSLPRVIEVSFNPAHFLEEESELFINNLKSYEGITRIIYSEDNYFDSWRLLGYIDIVRNTINDYWKYLYYGFGVLSLLLVLAMRIEIEKASQPFWLIYERAGGNMKYRSLKRFIGGLSIALPFVIIYALEYYLISKQILTLEIDADYFMIRLGACIVISFMTLLLIRKKKYV
jgi:hypothetical protein